MSNAYDDLYSITSSSSTNYIFNGSDYIIPVQTVLRDEIIASPQSQAKSCPSCKCQVLSSELYECLNCGNKTCCSFCIHVLYGIYFEGKPQNVYLCHECHEKWNRLLSCQTKLSEPKDNQFVELHGE